VSKIRVLHAQSFGAYGSPRIHESFKQRGRGIGRETSSITPLRQYVSRSDSA